MGRKQALKASRRELLRVVGGNVVDDFMNLVNNQNILRRDQLVINALIEGSLWTRLKWALFGTVPAPLKTQETPELVPSGD